MDNTALEATANNDLYMPTTQEIAEIVTEFAPMIRDGSAFGRISIANAGAGVFKVREPGTEEEDEKSVPSIEGVICASHPANYYWSGAYSATQTTPPDCKSLDGELGIDQDGVARNCAVCPHNQFHEITRGAETRTGKECRNRRVLYIMRKGDVLPMVMQIPPSSIKVYDKYLLYVRLQMRTTVNAVATRITLRNVRKDGGVVSVPVFEAVERLESGAAQRIGEYGAAVLRVVRGVPSSAPSVRELPQGYSEVPEDELPF